LCVDRAVVCLCGVGTAIGGRTTDATPFPLSILPALIADTDTSAERDMPKYFTLPLARSMVIRLDVRH
jgi:hypothetical protein